METLIQFKTAKLAQEKGIDIKNLLSSTDKNWYTRSGNLNGYTPKEPYYACSQSVLADWLRKEHNIHVNPFIKGWADLSSNYHCRITFVKDGLWEWFIPTKSNNNLSFEQAFERGLFEALSLI